MQLVSLSEVLQNFGKYYSDVVSQNDVVIVSKDGNLKENMVLVDLKSYNELQKAKETLDYMVSSEKSFNQTFTPNTLASQVPSTSVPIAGITGIATTTSTIAQQTPLVSQPPVVPNEPIFVETIYELCRYPDGTEVSFSNIVKNERGEDTIQVNFERSSYYGTDTVRFELPSYKILSQKGHYSGDEIARFKDVISRSEASFYKWARDGGPQITVY